MRWLVIIPVLNEEENIGPLLERILSLADERPDVLVVDDHSTDRTACIVAEYVSRYPQIFSITHQAAEHGLAHCYRAGFAFALDKGYDAVLTMDADLSHDPGDVPRLMRCLGQADWAVGSRYVAGGKSDGLTFGRRVLSRLANAYIRKKLGVDIADMTSGFNGFRIEVLKKIDRTRGLGQRGFIFQVALKYAALKAGFSLKEVPICFHHRYAGQSKFSLQIVGEALRVLGELRR